MGRSRPIPANDSPGRLVITVERVYFDSNIFVHAFECETDLGHAARRAFECHQNARIAAVTSILTLAEVLPLPYKTENLLLEETYESVLAREPLLEVLALSTSVLRLAARLRVELSMRLPDAIHVATAVQARCDSVLSEDKGIRVPSHMRRLDLSDRLFA